MQTSNEGKTRKVLGAFAGKLILLLIILGTAAGLHFSGVTDRVTPETVRQLADQFKNCPPLLYIAVFALAPVFLVPGFPFVILAGLLYGPVWGFIYGITGALFGAGLSFLSSRYICGDIVLAWQRKKKGGSSFLDSTEAQGWKLVLLLRLIPLFPYTPLNYALGATRVKFSHYILASLVGMTPACAAFILFSSTLDKAWNGRLDTGFFWGLAGVVAVSLAPVVYRRVRRRS